MSKNNTPYQTETLKKLGLNPDTITDEQRDIVLQPDEAPEIYAHDGGFTEAEKREIWREFMKRAGFTPLEVFNLEKKIF